MEQLPGNVLQREPGCGTTVLARFDQCHCLVSAHRDAAVLLGHSMEAGSLRAAGSEARTSNFRFVQNESRENTVRGRADICAIARAIHSADICP